jgi:hypothetical protein
MLYLQNVNTDVAFTIKMDFNSTLDGYFYPETVVYSSDKGVMEDLVSVDYKSILTKAGKWNPDGNILFMLICVEHGGDVTNKAIFDGIYLGGASFAYGGTASEAEKADTVNSEKSNAVITETEDGFTLTKEDYGKSAYFICSGIKASEEEHYININIKNISSNNWPYVYIYSDGNELCGTFPNVVRARPEMASSDFWMRIDLSEWADSFGDISVKVILETPDGASQTGVEYGGIYLGGSLIKDAESGNTESSGSSEETQESTEPSVSRNEPTIPGQNSEGGDDESSGVVSQTVSGDISGDSSVPVSSAGNDGESVNKWLLPASCFAAIALIAVAIALIVTKKRKKV